MNENLDKIFTDTANSIRSKRNITKSIKPTEFSTNIMEISGGNVETDIYKVKTITERNKLTAKEGDLCVVQNKQVQPIEETTPLKSITFNKNVTVNSGTYCNLIFISESGKVRFDCRIEPDMGMVQFNIEDNGNYININYSSNDNMNYTLENSENIIELSEEVLFSDMYGLFDTVINDFISTEVFVFSGLFVYEESAWKNAKINVDLKQYNLINGNKAYTDNGVIYGSLGTSSNGEEFKIINNLILSISSHNSVNNFNQLFQSYREDTIPITKYLKTDNVISMNNMFSDSSYLTSLDLSNFNTSKVTDMSYMFNGCRELTSLDISNFDTSSVTNMNNMFNGCIKLASLDVSGFDTSKVTIMSNMFENCRNVTSLDISGFNTSSVTKMSNMFDNVCRVTSLDLSNFDTSNVTDMASMFTGCSSLTSLDLSSFNTSKVKSFYSMFNDCSNITRLDLSNFEATITNESYVCNMFSGCTSLRFIDIRKINLTKVPKNFGMFTRVPNNCEIIVKDDSVKSVITTTYTNLTNVKTVAEYEA